MSSQVPHEKPCDSTRAGEYAWEETHREPEKHGFVKEHGLPKVHFQVPYVGLFPGVTLRSDLLSSE